MCGGPQSRVGMEHVYGYSPRGDQSKSETRQISKPSVRQGMKNTSFSCGSHVQSPTIRTQRVKSFKVLRLTAPVLTVLLMWLPQTQITSMAHTCGTGGMSSGQLADPDAGGQGRATVQKSCPPASSGPQKPCSLRQRPGKQSTPLPWDTDLCPRAPARGPSPLAHPPLADLEFPESPASTGVHGC